MLIPFLIWGLWPLDVLHLAKGKLDGWLAESFFLALQYPCWICVALFILYEKR
jgi:hypothetical protein